jgi:hypothetical protein
LQRRQWRDNATVHGGSAECFDSVDSISGSTGSRFFQYFTLDVQHHGKTRCRDDALS